MSSKSLTSLRSNLFRTGPAQGWAHIISDDYLGSPPDFLRFSLKLEISLIWEDVGEDCPTFITPTFITSDIHHPLPKIPHGRLSYKAVVHLLAKYKVELLNDKIPQVSKQRYVNFGKIQFVRNWTKSLDPTRFSYPTPEKREEEILTAKRKVIIKNSKNMIFIF